MFQAGLSNSLDLLEVFRLGLLTGAVSRQAVVAWADELIMQEADPDYFLIELSLSGHCNLNDIIELLNGYVGESKPEISKRVLLGLLFNQYQTGQTTLTQTVRAIDWLDTHLDYTPEEHSFMARMDDDHRLAEERIYGTIAEIEEFMLCFLSIYQSLRLDNQFEWEVLSAAAITHLSMLYQKLKTW